MSERFGVEASTRPTVTAVVVAHNGAPWLHELISGMQSQTRAPDRTVVVDTGSQDGSKEMLVGKLGGPVLDAPARIGFGAAVDRAVKALPPPGPDEWLWLLHDDCAPAPEALEALLRLRESVPEAAVVGPKVRDWPRGRRLLEFGVTIAGSGNRETGLEFGEFDQGQHDGVRDVLAVGTAGMLVRRDVFERLGGFDRRLGLFRDDVDFCWRVQRAGHRVVTCPDALVHHAEAGHRGFRRLDAVRGRPRRVDRRNAIYTLLVNSAAWMVPLIAVRLVIGSVLRILGLLVAKWPDAAYDEFRALLSAYSRPDLVVRGRRDRARQAKVSARAVRRLLPPPWIGVQHAVDALAALLSARSGTHVGSGRRARRAIESGPVAEEVEELVDDSPGAWRWLLARPPIIVVLLLVVVSLVACRNLFGAGALGGGALLPAPDSVMDLWHRAFESWHPVDLGSSRAAPPYLAVVAFLGTVLAGKAWLALDVLLLGAVPLAGLTSYFLMRRVVQTRPLRLWATVTYALLPAVTGAVAAGRLGTCVAIIVLPLVALAVLRMYGGTGAATGSWSPAWAAGLLLGVLTAFVPIGYVLALGFGIVAAVLPALYKPGIRTRIAVVLVVPPLVLLPWLPVLASNPGALLGEAGLALPGLADSDLAETSLLLGGPGGPGAAPVWMFGLLLLVALVALLRRDQGRGVLLAWGLSLAGLALGLVQSKLSVHTEWNAVSIPSWPGLAAVLVAAGWILAIVHGADGARRVFRQRSFSWRQPAIGALVVVAAAAPVLGAGWWIIRGAEQPLDRDAGAAVPPYIRSAQQSAAHPRALVVQVDGGAGRYAVLRGGAARLGDEQTGAPTATLAGLDSTVGDLVGETQREATAARLAAYGIGYVYLSAPADPGSVERLDGTPGLTRASAPQGAAAWKVDLPVGQLRILPPGSPDPRGDGTEMSDATSAQVLGIDPNGAAVTVPDGPAGRRLVLADAQDDGWRATISGQALRPTEYAGWAQAFELPATGGRLVLEHQPRLQGELLLIQGLLVLVFLVLALPTRARRDPPPLEPPGGRRSAGAASAEPRPGRRSAAQGVPVGSMAPSAGGAAGPPDPGRSREGVQP
ncbi:glycosyltransferase family 2 protein [Actinopolymorpha pittospori]|uniref:GT2 family glycosyltransferase n=1 Tax=Actinopolymorpha pittospori TaxID=648752 RepID=A0A927MWM5_9ACTN|nr:glycosyltransferase family 2 protein [Actinopolymorpha pittospori]MBE1607811.1 GT2 family glycosyltransferase [Actinopolymorpha pittospori]